MFAKVPFATANLHESVETICEFAASGRAGDVHLLNSYSITLTLENGEYADCVRNSTLNLPDGKPISVISRFYGDRLHQVRGPSFFEEVMNRSRSYGVKHYLLGGSPETLELLRSSLQSRYPGLQIVGTDSPPFRELSEDELDLQDQRIRSTQAQIVWVGLGTPKQDFEVARLASRGFLAVAVGAAFDFSAGTKPVAPIWMQACGIEWIHRLCTEPRRLWKRYAATAMGLIIALAKFGRSD